MSLQSTAREKYANGRRYPYMRCTDCLRVDIESEVCPFCGAPHIEPAYGAEAKKAVLDALQDAINRIGIGPTRRRAQAAHDAIHDEMGWDES